MGFGQGVLLAYAVLMVLGGVMGKRAGSKASLIAGVGSGVLLLVAWFVSMHHPVPGLVMGAVIAALLSATFGRRLAATRKLMPAGAPSRSNVFYRFPCLWKRLSPSPFRSSPG